MSQINVVKNAVSADQIYFDVTVSNFQSTTTIPPIFYYNEQRTLPFINNPEEYHLSILRFTVETGSLPLFVPSIQTGSGQTNRNLTIYSVTLTYGGFEAQEYVEWIPQDTSAEVPPPPSANVYNGFRQNNSTGYYNCYSYSYWCYLVDLAFRNAYNALVLLVAPALLPSIYSPILTWDSSTANGSGVIYADVAGYNISSPNPYISIYMNAPLFSLFNSFPSRYEGYAGVTNGKNFKIEIANVGSTNITVITPANQVVVPPAVPITWEAMSLAQEYSTTPQWSPITSIVFVSNTLPIQTNQVSTPLVFNEGGQISLGGNNANTANIITDLVSDTGSYRPNLVYEPTAEYRRITLYGNTPLFNLDIGIFWRDKLGALNPYRIGSGESVTIKLAFLKKDRSLLTNL